MQKYKQFLITVLIVLSFIFNAFSAGAADVSNKDTIIDTAITGYVTGNKGRDNDDTILDKNGGSVPQSDDSSDVHNNSVTIKDNGSVSSCVYGGITYGDGAVYENIVTIEQGGVADSAVLGGHSTGAGDVKGNTVIIDGGMVYNIVHGGNSSGSGNVEGNKVIINSDTANSDVYGGSTSGSGDVIGNKVIVNDRVSNGAVYGGHIMWGNGNANNNVVEIGGWVSSSLTGNVYGGYSRFAGDAAKNTVIISSTVALSVYGGYTGRAGAAQNNTVIISGSAKDIDGGYSNGDGAATSNIVIVESLGKVARNIYGGNTRGGDATYNIVDISGSVTNVVGGKGGANAINNTVIISGTARGYTYGGTCGGNAIDNVVLIESDGIVQGDVYGGVSGANISSTVKSNIVTVAAGGKADNDVFGGRAKGTSDVTENKVIVEANGIVGRNVYGGNSNGAGDVTDNSVEIGGTVFDSVYGGVTNGDGNVSGNSVEISGTINNEVYGGLAYGTGNVIGNSVEISGDVNYAYGGWADGDGDVYGNSVEISGTVTNEVYGGGALGVGMVNNNTVTIGKTANLASASLFGRNNNAGGGTGNTLNVNSFIGNVVEINNFDIYNITIGQLDSSMTVINITGSTPTDIDGAIINISFAPEFAYNALTSGDVITVISYINLPPYSGKDPTVMVASSSFVTYDYIETHDTGQLLLTLTGLSVNPETSFVGEGFAASLAFLGQSADVRSSIYFVPQGPRFIPFAKMVYGKQHISTGSSVKVKGFSAIAGLALNTNFDNGSQLVVGAFIEGGWGDYDSRNSFRNSATIKGKGDTEYYGGGVLARYALKCGSYSEGSFAAGKTETDFRTYDFTPGTRSKYDYSAPYYSAHLAVGQVLDLTDMLNLDIYGKYLWTRQAGDTVTVDGSRFKFKAADSNRLRAGGKLKADVSPQLQPYAGAAYEYEFSGRIKGSLYGMNLDKPSLRGGTGIGELGLVWTPKDAQNLRVDLGVQGYAGKREGMSGGLTVTMSF